MKLSVVIATYNRANLIARSLETYLNQSFPLDEMELIYVADWDEDETDALLKAWSSRLPIVTIRPPYKQPGTWRSEASIINLGIRAAQGKLIIATHPEVMVGKDSLSALWETRQENTYLSCKAYYLTPWHQEQLDTVDWRSISPAEAVMQLDGFYDATPGIVGGDTTYAPPNVDQARTWESWLFGGGMRSMWRTIGGFYPFKTWGSVDVWFLNARRKHGIPTLTPRERTTYVVHQNHDRLDGQHRDMQACIASIRNVPLQANELW